MNIAYIGRNYKGVQHQRREGIKTVLETLETALGHLHPSNNINAVSSSRTDKGVNALSNAVHVDLEHNDPGEEYQPDQITSVLNRHLIHADEDIRVLRTLRVRDDFHCRWCALSRTYVYRITLSKSTRHDWSTPFNPFDYMKTFAVYKNQADLDLVRRTADVLSGTHNFSGFTSYEYLRDQPWLNPVKTLEVSVENGVPFLGHHFPEYYMDNFENVEFVFKGSSFLYKQVRKMAGVMLAVGQGLLELDTVKKMLVNPRKVKFNKTALYKIPTYALYLKDVEYNPQDLIFNPMDTGKNNQVNTTLSEESCFTQKSDIENNGQTVTSSPGDTTLKNS